MTLVDEVTNSMSTAMKPIGQSKVDKCASKACGASCSKLQLMHVLPVAMFDNDVSDDNNGTWVLPCLCLTAIIMESGCETSWPCLYLMPMITTMIMMVGGCGLVYI